MAGKVDDSRDKSWKQRAGHRRVEPHGHTASFAAIASAVTPNVVPRFAKKRDAAVAGYPLPPPLPS
jgi:hypothetical protein